MMRISPAESASWAITVHATRYVNDVKGVNSRLDPIQAAVLSAKLDLLDEWNDRRRQIAVPVHREARR